VLHLTTPDAQTRIFRGYGDGFVGAGGAQKSGCKHGIKHDRDNNADDIDTNNGREMGVSPFRDCDSVCVRFICLNGAIVCLLSRSIFLSDIPFPPAAPQFVG